MAETRSDKPSASIDASASCLRWKVVVDNETVASGTAETKEAAQAAADEVIVKLANEPFEGP